MRDVMIRGVLALPCLAVFDYAIVAAAFLGEPQGGEWTLAAIAALLVASFVLSCEWLVFVAQNAVLVLVTAHALLGGPMPNASDLIQLLGLFAIGNLLAWPGRNWQNDGAHRKTSDRRSRKNSQLSRCEI